MGQDSRLFNLQEIYILVDEDISPEVVVQPDEVVVGVGCDENAVSSSYQIITVHPFDSTVDNVPVYAHTLYNKESPEYWFSYIGSVDSYAFVPTDPVNWLGIEKFRYQGFDVEVSNVFFFTVTSSIE